MSKYKENVDFIDPMVCTFEGDCECFSCLDDDEINEIIDQQIDSKIAELDIVNKAVTVICKYEGFRNKPYKDAAGVLTIGHGLTSSTKNFNRYIAKGYITEAESKQEVAEYVKADYNAIKSICDYLEPNQVVAVLSWCYNLGLNNWNRSTLRLKILNRLSTIEIADEFLKWNRAGGKVLAGLTKRRREERQLFMSC